MTIQKIKFQAARGLFHTASASSHGFTHHRRERFGCHDFCQEPMKGGILMIDKAAFLASDTPNSQP
jgi:hypothetical protein